LSEIHLVATGANVVVALIDSEIDVNHPDLNGVITDRFDAGCQASEPHPHGTAMAGAIAARNHLVGVAPGVRILAICAFGGAGTVESTSLKIVKGIDWAASKGARIINMSFAGPPDPLLQQTLHKARDKGMVLVAAAGNEGPASPPLYPAADPSVIAVTATDANDKLMPQANRGSHIALAAPGVDILEPHPNASYQLTTGTSVAAAHVSGIAALLLDREPMIDTGTIRDVLTSSAKQLDPKGRNNQFGWGLVDPYRALSLLEAKRAQIRSKTQKAATGAR
jgi:subtilisin family serine protease